MLKQSLYSKIWPLGLHQMVKLVGAQPRSSNEATILEVVPLAKPHLSASMAPVIALRKRHQVLSILWRELR